MWMRMVLAGLVVASVITLTAQGNGEFAARCGITEGAT
jgi:hypothetical protein